MYPNVTDYEVSLSAPQKTLLSPELKEAKPLSSNNGMGFKSYTGGFATVYPVLITQKEEEGEVVKKYALRCWLTADDDIRSIYQGLEKFLNTDIKGSDPSFRRYFADFKYYPNNLGIRAKVNGNWEKYPILRMGWIEGDTLCKYIEGIIYKDPNSLKKVANTFLEMVKDFHRKEFSHGDLQEGNIIVAKTKKGESKIEFFEKLEMKVIDYDTIFVKGFEDKDVNNGGVPGYQSPFRSTVSKRCYYIDYFSELIIYLSLLVYAEQPSLWQKDQEKSLLFKGNDLRNSDKSRIFRYLQYTNFSPEVKRLTIALRHMCKVRDLSKLLKLEDVIRETQISTYPPSTEEVCFFCGCKISDLNQPYCNSCQKPIHDYTECPNCHSTTQCFTRTFCTQCGKTFPVKL